jgi:hypothetical protein
MIYDDVEMPSARRRLPGAGRRGMLRRHCSP